jgi:hypothetical protein
MSTQINYIFDNFIYQIEKIFPTSTLMRTTFIYFDPTSIEPEISEGFGRHFYIEWTDSDANLSSSDSDRREAWHGYRVNVFYPLILTFADMHKLILSDRHDLLYVLRRKQYRVGYNADNPTTEIGLLNRYRSGDELDKSINVWQLSIDYRCKILENEQ